MKKEKVVMLTLLIVVSSIAVLFIDIEYCTGTLNRFTSYEELKEFIKYRRPEFKSPQYPSSLNSYDLSELKTLDEGGYSRTSIQVEGVDEADIVKTDGEYIYVISDQKVVIVKACPAEEAAVLSKIIVNGTLKQIFINEKRLVVFYENDSRSEIKTFIDCMTYQIGKIPKSKGTSPLTVAISVQG